jgi:predicted nuclease with TOPRIM domain
MNEFRALEQRLQALETKISQLTVSWEEKREELDFPEEIFKKLPAEVQKTIEGIKLNYQKDFPVFCFFGMRKALIDAIRIRFKRDGKENKLYDKQGRAYKLAKWIELAKQERYISPNIAKKLQEEVKVFGDVASHDYMVNLQKDEVPSIFKHLRLALARMYHE